MAFFESGTFSWTSHFSTPEEDLEVRDIMNSLPINEVEKGCKGRRGGVDCEVVSDLWATGTQNFILQVKFVDGVCWVIKSSIPSRTSQSTYSDPEPYRYEPFVRYKRETDAMNFLRQYTDLPVPEPHGVLFFQAQDSNPACACLMMDFVAGINGREFFIEGLWKADLDRQADFHQVQERILRSLARIQVTLGKFQSSAIGYLGRRNDGTNSGTPVVDGYEVANGTGSYQSPADCYRSILAGRNASLVDREFESLEDGRTARRMLDVMGSTIPYVCEAGPRSYLTLADNGGHNVVCDNEGNLVSLIDVDTLWFAPIEMAAQIPAKILLAHSFDDSSLLRWRPASQTKAAYLAQYVGLIRQAGNDTGEPRLGELLASKMRHYSAVVVAGLFAIKKSEPAAHEEWLMAQRIARLEWLGLGSLRSTILLPPGTNDAAEEDLVDATEDTRAPTHQRHRDVLRFLLTGECGLMPREVLTRIARLAGGVEPEEEGSREAASSEQRRLSRLLEACDEVPRGSGG